MIELIKALALGFTIGVSAALIPGPMMFATIGISLEKGWRTGPFIFLGHSMVEISIILLIIGGVSSFIGRSTIAYMSIVGGIIMILFGLVILKSAKSVSTMDIHGAASKVRISKSPVFAGILTSALNPTYILWWLTAGSAIILQEYLIGTIAIIAFVIGHWLADLGFLVTVSSSTSRGKDFISRKNHKLVLYFCGSFMMIFGIWFIFNYNNLSTML
ncbi:Threonine/homoserine/homoserine lactone efflux protein [Methanococcoides vulcani]|uniref:Threonine/homoserine/homoserine lactone efflux protein n=1 Tax=Methanococcoides vulcani TaxID=1353158 RepID=A0A1H9ZZR7_9EURY|nr:LysE family transporter [Methanococcoides vulcani]SES87266.1 Threonine/homoserine/homoserine lactone efflux protein [Methanococcoides vulcani]